MMNQGLLLSSIPVQQALSGVESVWAYNQNIAADNYVFITDANNPTQFSNLYPGTSDFCIEAWVNSGRTISNIFSTGTNAGADTFSFYVNSTFIASSVYNLTANFPNDTGGTSTLGGSPNFTANNFVGQWNHIAIVRNGNTLTLYWNGQIQSQQTGGLATSFDATNIGTPTFNLFGGPVGDHDQTNTYAYNGVYRNFRYVIGQPVYTAAFVPPPIGTNLTAIAGTQLLFAPLTTSVQTTIVDESGNNFVLSTYVDVPTYNFPYPQYGILPYTSGTPAGTNPSQTWSASGTPNTPTTITTITPVIGTSCGNFDKTGTGVRIVSTGTQNVDPGKPTGVWSIDGWIYIPASTDGTVARDLVTTEVTNGVGIRLGPSETGSGMNYLSVFANGTANLSYAPIIWPRNTWVYFCVSINNPDVGMWVGVNGSPYASPLTVSAGAGGSANTYSFAAPDSNGVSIGARSGSTTSPGYYLNMIRFYKGFMYSQIGYEAQMPWVNPPVVDNITNQLLLFQGTNGGTTFTNQTS